MPDPIVAAFVIILHVIAAILAWGLVMFILMCVYAFQRVVKDNRRKREVNTIEPFDNTRSAELLAMKMRKEQL